MTEKMKTICVGRFLVDVPSQAEVSLSREMMDGFDIDTVEEDEASFRKRVAAREAEITAQDGMVAARDLQVPGMIGRLFIHGRTRSYSMEGSRRVDDEWVSVGAYAHLDGVSFSLSMQYADVPDGRTAEALLARLRLRGETEIPSVPGFCIGRAIFTDPLPPHKTEHIAMHVGFRDHPDVALALASLPGGGRDRSLLGRFADMDTEASADELLRVTKLRIGKRRINGINGEEVLERIREQNFASTYGFTWETQGARGDLLHPFLSLELQGGISPRPGGKPVETSLHEDAVLALWDRISSTIRPRPVTPTNYHPPLDMSIAGNPDHA
ncbi:T6SS immunity protein Tli4 family protein [Massilia rhizosphaerae]|uniref:T6SS immunity protein Tli4 family protein n=1 Tax=Massilia rhizosphaerae TaxID=2784389 RepID=UPI0018DE5FF6|nr:T6SS immunity protein Tli4 family protein [Massilia rhizosphaerae]